MDQAAANPDLVDHAIVVVGSGALGCASVPVLGQQGTNALVEGSKAGLIASPGRGQPPLEPSGHCSARG